VGVLNTGQRLATIGKSIPAGEMQEKCRNSPPGRRDAMQRPWFRRQTWSWYVEIDGKQHNLGKHPSDKAPR
jgi:hypothetical protein